MRSPTGAAADMTRSFLGALVAAWLAAWLAAAMPAALGRGAIAHPGPSVWGEMTIEPTKLLFRIEGAADPFRTNLQLPHLPIGPLEPDQERDNRAAIERFIRDELKVTFDGVAIAPRLVFVYVQDGKPEEMSWRSTRIDLEYDYLQEPQKISLHWPRFEGEGITYVPIVIRRGAKGIPRQFQVHPEEPEYTWHADSVRPRIQGKMKTFAVPKTKVEVPVPSVVLLLVAALVLGLRRRIAPVPRFAVFLAAVIGAVLAKPYGVARVPNPFTPTAPLPSDPQAREIFSTLNANVYRAFEAESESAIYDLLADSVAGELLDDLYGQIYESLILREQGGPICSVESVEDLEGKIDLVTLEDADPPQFAVDWHWRVMGAVSHYGHIHRRMNEYRASFVVRHDGDNWKIARVTVTDHQRVDDYE